MAIKVHAWPGSSSFVLTMLHGKRSDFQNYVRIFDPWKELESYLPYIPKDRCPLSSFVSTSISWTMFPSPSIFSTVPLAFLHSGSTLGAASAPCETACPPHSVGAAQGACYEIAHNGIEKHHCCYRVDTNKLIRNQYRILHLTAVGRTRCLSFLDRAQLNHHAVLSQNQNTWIANLFHSMQAGHKHGAPPAAASLLRTFFHPSPCCLQFSQFLYRLMDFVRDAQNCSLPASSGLLKHRSHLLVSDAICFFLVTFFSSWHRKETIGKTGPMAMCVKCATAGANHTSLLSLLIAVGLARGSQAWAMKEGMKNETVPNCDLAGWAASRKDFSLFSAFSGSACWNSWQQRRFQWTAMFTHHLNSTSRIWCPHERTDYSCPPISTPTPPSCCRTEKRCLRKFRINEGQTASSTKI